MPVSSTSRAPFPPRSVGATQSVHELGVDGHSSAFLQPTRAASLPFLGAGVSRLGQFEPTLWRLYRVFASIVRYHRMAARCESFHGGHMPEKNLKGFISGWAKEVLPLLRVEVRRAGLIAPLETPALFVGNHLSYLDVPLLMSQVPVVFLGKAEIAKWPILGAAGRLAGMVFVQRESDGSRREASRAILECLQTRGMSLGLFPSGTTSLDERRPWRSGAFRIAQEGQVPIQPFRLSYDPEALAAFVGKDTLLPHLYRLLRSGPVRAQIEFGEPRLVSDPATAAEDLWLWSRSPLSS